MPELPEVETIKNVLKENLINQEVLDLKLYYKPLLEGNSPYPLEALIGAYFESFQRRGKYLVFGFSNGLYWVVHLRMEGKFHLFDAFQEKSKHTHLILKTPHTLVHYLDTRKFSRMAVVDDLDTYFQGKHLGLEPFDKKLDVAYLQNAFKNRTAAIKGILLDQSIITGIGNIYADEILFLSKIHPLSNPSKLNAKDLKIIIENTQIVLKKAIEQGGTTIRSYTSSLGVTGRFQVALNVYGRFNEPCSLCGHTLKKLKIVGRTSVYCEKCQKVRK